MTWASVDKVLPSAIRNCATEEGREVEAVFEVDAAVLCHGLHLVFVDNTQIFSLYEQLNQETSETDNLNSIATDFKQAWYVCSELFLL